MMQLGDVLRQVRLEKGLTQTQVADRLTISQAYYNRIEAAKVKPPSFYIIDKLAVILNIDRNKLVKLAEKASIEYKQKQLDNERKTLGIKSDLAKSRPIPILSEIPAGTPKDYTDQDYPPGIAEEYYEFKVNDPNVFFLKAESDCMSPEIKKGDLLLITPDGKVESGDIAAVVNGKGEKEVRRVTIRNDQMILTAENPVYPVIVWEKKDKPKIIGRVKEIIRRR